MDKQQVLAEVKRVAQEMGRPPGWEALRSRTAIRKSDWYPHLWLRWSDVLSEAGYAPNQFQSKTSDAELIQHYVRLVRELGHLPVSGELRRKTRADSAFPSDTLFNRFGGKDKLVEAVAAFCRATPGHEDVVGICDAYRNTSTRAPSKVASDARKVPTGFVYLMKSGRHYKIGHTNSVGRRGSELSIKIPVPPTTIHSIETDDPVGVEAYWHRRFADKRGEGEWFQLSPDNVKAFKRWKRIA